LTEAYRTPDDRFQDLPGYPFEPHYQEFEGLRLHYVDEGRVAGGGDPVLLLHGGLGGADAGCEPSVSLRRRLPSDAPSDLP